MESELCANRDRDVRMIGSEGCGYTIYLSEDS